MMEIEGKPILVRVSVRFELSGADCISKPVYVHDFVIQSELSQLPREAKTVVSTSLIVYCCFLIN